MFRFGLFEADAGHGTLTRNGTPVRIQDQPFRVLIHLLEQRGTIVSRDRLRHLLWGDETFVGFDASLNVILNRLRAALRDDSENPRFIETVPRHGYRFIAPVTVADYGSSPAGGSPSLRTDSDVPGTGGSSTWIGRRWWPRALQLTAVAALGAAAALLVMNRERAAPDVIPVVRSQVLAPPNSDFVSTSLALSNDGRMLAFVARASTGAPPALWVEAMNSGSTHRLTGTDGATLPFWSPDGQNIGFFAHDKLWRVGKDGGPPQPLCDAPLGRGGTWNNDGVIVFAPDLTSPLQKISAAGGTATPVSPTGSQAGTMAGWWPQFLPDGQHFIFWSHRSKTSEVDGIYLAALSTNERTLLTATETNGLYANGHLLYVHDRHLLARSLDPVRLSVGTASETVTEDVGIHEGMHLADFAASQNGLLAYFAGDANRGWSLVMYDPSGTPKGRIVPSQDIYLHPRFSPDGKRLAISIERPGTSLDDVWVIDPHGMRTRVTFGSGDSTHPVWSADGTTVYYASDGSDHVPHIYARPANGAGEPTPVLADAGVSEIPMDVSRDGRDLAYARRENGKKWEVWLLPLSTQGSPHALVRLPQANVTDPAFSPDGTLLAYATDETGRFEIYISRLGGAGRWQATTGGGTDPVWSPDGRRLYYMDDAENVMYVDVRHAGGAVGVGTPAMFIAKAAFKMPRPLAVAPDGSLLVNGHHDGPAAPTAITLVVNWPAELKGERSRVRP